MRYGWTTCLTTRLILSFVGSKQAERDGSWLVVLAFCDHKCLSYLHTLYWLARNFRPINLVAGRGAPLFYGESLVDTALLILRTTTTMGNSASRSSDPAPTTETKVMDPNDKGKFKSFPGSAILEKAFCGSIDTTDPSEYEGTTLTNRLLKKADIMCVSDNTKDDSTVAREGPHGENKNPSSELLARALVSEVTDNPKTMKPDDMAAREFRLLKAQKAAAANKGDPMSPRAIGAPGGVGQANVLNSLAFAVTGDDSPHNLCAVPGQAPATIDETFPMGPYAITIGLSLSRRYANIGNPNSTTRQTAYDFNELQDRENKYVASVEGWRAGGGTEEQPDTVHIPIIHLDCQSQQDVDRVIHALASGEIFIPQMQVLPEALSVQGVSPPDLVLRFGCERNEDLPPDEWPNWCLEFIHNQLYEYFHEQARWAKRPFTMTLAKKVRWKTVKHMNRYFAHAERVLEGWRSEGPQLLKPQLSYVDGGASPEEVKSPHGIYLMRNGVPTNYFGPNFEPPYTTKMTRSLLSNVLNKSWDKKRREWTSEPIPKLLTPSMLMAAACGCADPNAGGFMATEATRHKIAEQKLEDEPRTQVRAESAMEFPVEKSAPSDSEEKKQDDSGARSGKVLDKHKSRYSMGEETTAPSEFAQSVAMSGTTVMHQNLTGSKDNLRLYSDEDWTGDALESPQTWSKKKKESTASSSKQALDKERQRQSELLAKVNEEKANKSPHYTMQSSSSQSKKQDMEFSDPGLTMEYSADGSSAFFNQDQSLFGQHFVNAGSDVSSPVKSKSKEDDEGSALSIQESTSSAMSVVPTDEELFAIGWAKALDPNSGSYYYFTLDRKKTVWENPLSSNQSSEPIDP